MKIPPLNHFSLLVTEYRLGNHNCSDRIVTSKLGDLIEHFCEGSPSSRSSWGRTGWVRATEPWDVSTLIREALTSESNKSRNVLIQEAPASWMRSEMSSRSQSRTQPAPPFKPYKKLEKKNNKWLKHATLWSAHTKHLQVTKCELA